MNSRTAGMLSQMQARRAERKKPKRFVALKKVALDASQQEHISNAQANLPKHPVTQKHIKQSSTAFTVAMLFHALIAIFIATYVIVDQIEVMDETFNISIVTEELKAKRRFIGRERPKFNKATPAQQKLVLNQPVRTNTAQLPAKDGLTIPQGPETALDLTSSGIDEGPATIDFNRNFVKPATTIQPETKAPSFEIERDVPTLIDKLDTPEPDAELGVGNIEFTTEPGITKPTYKFRVKPKYPDSAKKAEKEGTVILQATIDENGIPKDIVALTNLGFGFEQAAIEALKKTTFRPATKAGKPISLEQVQIPYEFKLEDN